MTLKLLSHVETNIGLYAGREVETWDDLPPREDGQVWLEGERRFRLNKALEKVELPRFTLVHPTEHEVVE